MIEKKFDKNNRRIVENKKHEKSIKLALSRGIMYNNHGDAHFLNCLYSFAIKRNLNLIKKYMKTKIFVTLYNAFQKH